MNLNQVWDIQYPSEDYVPQTFLLWYFVKEEDKLSFRKWAVLRENADETINEVESLPEFNRWCTEHDLKEAMKALARWSYNSRWGRGMI